MISKSFSYVRSMGCCGCFGFTRKPKRIVRPYPIVNKNLSQELLLDLGEDDDNDDCFSDMNDMRSYNGETTNTMHEDDDEMRSRAKRSEEVVRLRIQNGLICRDVPVREVHKVVRDEDEEGNKTVNEYVRECKIGAGSYGKVVLYRSRSDGKYYAIKSFHKSHLSKLRVAPSETAMTDVLREVLIMKTLRHPNIVNLVEVIDDPSSDNFYMVLEYVESKWVCEGTGPECSLEENTARKYLRDIVSGLMYLHAHNIVHGDIKPDNLLVSSSGTVKIGDFSVSQVFEDDGDELRRSPGTPVFTAPECCLGLTYHGKAADTWAVGVTLYCMIMGQYPFLGDSLQDTYDKIVNNPLVLRDDLNPNLKDLIEGLLCKDPKERLTLKDVAEHPWVVSEDGPIPSYICWCKQSGQANLQLHHSGQYDPAKELHLNGHTSWDDNDS
uniref:non-specific serine/threonine protein kinase n=1 Tax=Kalanchoe fedtschenkoi TaxID=63787 RepID=A0A7N0V5M2_KALFE